MIILTRGLNKTTVLPVDRISINQRFRQEVNSKTDTDCQVDHVDLWRELTDCVATRYYWPSLNILTGFTSPGLWKHYAGEYEALSFRRVEVVLAASLMRPLIPLMTLFFLILFRPSWHILPLPYVYSKR
jgi:hypothetical protein